jgi:hypothetical protein
MRLSIPIPRHALPATLLVMALGFGASSALADVAQMACDDPAAWGTCHSALGCANLCETMGGPTWASMCSGQCCYCFEGAPE